MGPISVIGNLTIANFSTVDNGARNGTGPNGGSRNFRGLMDEMSVYNKALTLAEIHVAQKATPGVPHPASPSLAASLEGKQVVITWSSTSSFQLQKRETVNAGAWINETTAPVVNGNLRTVTLPNSGSALFFRLISN